MEWVKCETSGTTDIPGASRPQIHAHLARTIFVWTPAALFVGLGKIRDFGLKSSWGRGRQRYQTFREAAGLSRSGGATALSTCLLHSLHHSHRISVPVHDTSQDAFCMRGIDLVSIVIRVPLCQWHCVRYVRTF